MADVSVVVVTLDGLPWVEQCLASVAGAARETIVVDHGSTDGTVALVRERFPEVRVIEQGNVGYGAGMNAGIRVAAGEWVLVLNSDAWAEGDASGRGSALERLVAFAEANPEAAVVGPRLLNQDGSLQRSVRGFPSLWRLATEYLFLRKLAPGSRAFNAFYAGGFDHASARESEWVMGAVLLVRRAAADQVGLFDESFFLFSEETDWCRRFRDAGWQVWFCPDASFTHVGGASHGGRMFTENLRGHLRFLAKHEGLRPAGRARLLLLWSLRLRGLLFPGGRGAMYRSAARWLASGDVRRLLDEPRPGAPAP
jgi:GT2 family glycosyltransferase